MEFKVKKIRHMQPRQGNKYSTTYYIQNQNEYQRTYKFIADIVEQILILASKDHELMQEISLPLPGYKKVSSNQNYSILEIFNDLIDQYHMQKDWPSGMINRWNRLFQDQEHNQIHFVEE